MDLLNLDIIEKIEQRLLLEMKRSYGDHPNLWIRIDRAVVDYLDEPYVTLEISFGNTGSDKDTKWNKQVELPFLVDSPEYIAGQFAQALIEKEL